LVRAQTGQGLFFEEDIHRLLQIGIVGNCHALIPACWHFLVHRLLQIGIVGNCCCRCHWFWHCERVHRLLQIGIVGNFSNSWIWVAVAVAQSRSPITSNRNSWKPTDYVSIRRVNGQRTRVHRLLQIGIVGNYKATVPSSFKETDCSPITSNRNSWKPLNPVFPSMHQWVNWFTDYFKSE